MDRTIRLASFLASDLGNLPLACDYLDAVLVEGGLPCADMFAELRRIHADAPEFLRRIARLELVQGQLEAARVSYERLLDADPKDAVVRHDLAFVLLCMGQNDAAERVIQQGWSAFGATPELALLWARTAYLRGDHAEALTRLGQLAETSASIALESLVRWDRGDAECAVAAAQRALALDARESDARLVLASAALVDRDGRRAMEWIAPLVEAQPRHGRALSVMGQALLLLGDPAGGREALQRAVRFMPDHIGTWHVLAWVHLLAGEVDQAHAAYEQAYAIDRNFGETHGGLALIHALRGERAEAQVALRKALRLAPTAVTAQLARFLLESNEAAGAAAAAPLVAAMRGLPELAGIEPEAVLKGLRARLTNAGAKS
jgi:Flp pilus assembly protein TadD